MVWTAVSKLLAGDASACEIGLVEAAPPCAVDAPVACRAVRDSRLPEVALRTLPDDLAPGIRHHLVRREIVARMPLCGDVWSQGREIGLARNSALPGAVRTASTLRPTGDGRSPEVVAAADPAGSVVRSDGHVGGSAIIRPDRGIPLRRELGVEGGEVVESLQNHPPAAVRATRGISRPAADGSAPDMASAASPAGAVFGADRHILWGTSVTGVPFLDEVRVGGCQVVEPGQDGLVRAVGTAIAVLACSAVDLRLPTVPCGAPPPGLLAGLGALRTFGGGEARRVRFGG